MPIIFLFSLFLFSSQNFVSGAPAEIIASSGDQILLSCPVNTQDCGAYHSLKWYHEDTRVYVFSPTAQFKNAEGALMSRGTLEVSKFFDYKKVFKLIMTCTKQIFSLL